MIVDTTELGCAEYRGLLAPSSYSLLIGIIRKVKSHNRQKDEDVVVPRSQMGRRPQIALTRVAENPQHSHSRPLRLLLSLIRLRTQ